MGAHRRQPGLLRFGAGLTVALCPLARAQMHHVDAPERVTRAVGVYEWTGDLTRPSAARFVPVSLFIDGHFEDAGLYLARPVPFALQPGDVYALEKSGQPQGLLDLNEARRVVTGNALADDNPEGAWYAFGKFTPETESPGPHLRASHKLPKLEVSAGPNTPAGTKVGDTEDSGAPHMNRRSPVTPGASSSPGTPSSPAGSSQTGSSSPASDSGSATTKSTTTTASDDDDPDRPTLRRRDPSQDAARRRALGGKNNAASVTAAGPALGDDPDRPTLGRGSTEDAGTPPLTGLPADMHQAVAVSDAAHIDAHPFAREWDSPAERAETLAAMEALAKPRLAAYLAANNLVPSALPVASSAPGQATSPIPAANPAAQPATDAGAPPRLQRGVPTPYQQQQTAAAATQSASPTASASATSRNAALRRTTHPAGSAPGRRPAPLTLSQATISGYTLSYGGLPTFVYSAAASVAPAKVSGAAVPGTNPVAYITVVAQRLPSGNLQVALSSVTDSAHLDRSPRLRLIDAVDPDDSHRASLLFELRGTSSREFALYRLTSAQAEQTFTTASIE